MSLNTADVSFDATFDNIKSSPDTIVPMGQDLLCLKRETDKLVPIEPAVISEKAELLVRSHTFRSKRFRDIAIFSENVVGVTPKACPIIENRRNNADAKMRDGFVFDDATGLIYVPKKYTEKNKKGELKVASSRIQLLYATADKGAENSISVKISEDGVDGDVAENGTAKVDILATDTKIVLAKDKAARESLKDSSIDSVIANGIEYTRDMDMWSYDEGNGTLDLKLAPAGVRTVKVKLTNDTGKTVGNFLTSIATKAFAGNVNNIGTWKFNTAPYVGMTFHTNGHNKYTGTPTGGYTMPAVENPSGGRYETKTIYQALGTQGVDVSALQSGNYSIERTCTINAQTTSSGVEIPNAANLNLTCGHVGVNPSGQLQNGYNQPKYTDDDYGQTVRVAAVYGNEAVVGVTVPTTFTQAGAGFFKVNWQLNKVNVTFSKISADAKVTNGNSEYSYAGAEFDIYRTRDNALAAHITMNGIQRKDLCNGSESRPIEISRNVERYYGERPRQLCGNGLYRRS